MKEDKELKRKIQSEFEKPSVPFNEWAVRHGVPTVPETEEVLVPADNVNGRGIGNILSAKIISFIAVAFAIVIVIAVILTSVFLRQPVVYGVDDTSIVNIEMEEVEQVENVYLFDMANVAKIEETTKDLLKTDNSQILLYTIYNSILSVENGEGMDGFYFTYYIRTYHNYEFMHYKNFEDLNSKTTVNGKQVKYKLVEEGQTYGYASFTVGSYEYFIEARGFEGVTQLNEENFINLLNKVLI